MSRLSPAAREGIRRLTSSLSPSKAAELLERAERAAASAIALTEMEHAASAAVGRAARGADVSTEYLALTIAAGLRDELDGGLDVWGVEDRDEVDRRTFKGEIAEREARGDKAGADALRSDLAAFDAEERAREQAVVAAERARAAAASEAAAERAEVEQLIGTRK